MHQPDALTGIAANGMFIHRECKEIWLQIESYDDVSCHSAGHEVALDGARNFPIALQGAAPRNLHIQKHLFVTPNNILFEYKDACICPPIFLNSDQGSSF